MQETTIAAIATAPGAGGIAVVRLSGAQSYAVAERAQHLMWPFQSLSSQ